MNCTHDCLQGRHCVCSTIAEPASETTLGDKAVSLLLVIAVPFIFYSVAFVSAP